MSDDTIIPNMYATSMEKHQIGTFPLYAYQNVTRSFTNNDSKPLAIGVAVIRKIKNGVNGIALPEVGTTYDQIIGFTIMQRAYPIQDNSKYEPWRPNETTSVMTIGSIILPARNGAGAGENVFVYVSAGKFGEIAGGAADSTDGASTIELPGCKWDEDVEAGKSGPVTVHNLTYKPIA